MEKGMNNINIILYRNSINIYKRKGSIFIYFYERNKWIGLDWIGIDEQCVWVGGKVKRERERD